MIEKLYNVLFVVDWSDPIDVFFTIAIYLGIVVMSISLGWNIAKWTTKARH